MTQSITQSINQPINLSMTQSIHQSMTQPIHQSMTQSFLQWPNHSFNDPINLSTNQPINHVRFQEVIEQPRNTIHFIRLHAPWPLLTRYAEELNLRAPIQVTAQTLLPLLINTYVEGRSRESDLWPGLPEFSTYQNRKYIPKDHKIYHLTII
jgi:hypothetical protein